MAIERKSIDEFNDEHVKSVTACDFIAVLVSDVSKEKRSTIELCHLIIELLDLVDLERCFKLIFDAYNPNVILELISTLELQEIS